MFVPHQGLGACYNWTQPCASSMVTETCAPTEQRGTPTCAPTATWFWILAALAAAAVVVKSNKGAAR